MLKPEGPRARTVYRAPVERPEWRGPPSKSYDLQLRTQQDHCLPAGMGTGRLSKLTLSTLPPISCQHSPLAECTQKPEWEGDYWLASWSQSNGEGWKMDLGKQEKTLSMLTKWSISFLWNLYLRYFTSSLEFSKLLKDKGFQSWLSLP